MWYRLLMDRSSVSFTRLLTGALYMAAPTWVAFAALVVCDALSPMAALIAASLTTVALLMVSSWVFSEWLNVLRWARTLAQGADPNALKPRETLITSDPVAAVGVVWRAWQRERETLAGTVDWHLSLFARLPDPLILLGDDRRVTNLNPAAKQTFGRDIIGRDLSAVLRAPDILEAADAVLNGETIRAIEFTLPVPVERTFLAQVLSLDMVADDGTRAVLTLHDITSVRRAEQMRADFVANASHELRTPLSTLLGFIETLRGPARDDVEARDRFLAIMQDQASRMARLVQDLLSLSRIELNEHSLPQDKVDLAKLVKKAAEAMQPIAHSRHMSLDIHIHPFDGPWGGLVMGQEDELTQVLQNLLDNALKYGREKTSVTIEVKPAAKLPAAVAHYPLASTVVISVADEGDGIAREHLPRLTERFYRVDPARSRQLGGTGLGLAIVKHIVNRHRGALVVESTPGKGSVFSVYFPMVHENVKSALPQMQKTGHLKA